MKINLIIGALITTLLLSAVSMIVTTARAMAQPEPYGGCIEAIDYPRSEGADICRKLGYVVTRHIIVSPRDYVLTWRDLPRCTRNGPLPCHAKNWSYFIRSGGTVQLLNGRA